jgi:uncharacterized protein DUF2802
MTATPSVETLLLAGRALFLVFSFIVAAISFTAWRRATRRQSEQILAHSAELLARLGALESRVEGRIEGRLAAIAHSLAQLDERLERQPQHGSATPGYQIAIRLAKSGASCDELVSNCGLARGEAELLQRLHGGSGRAAA